MNSTAITCPATGDSDLYGLGNRIAIYIQMATVQLSGFASVLLETDDASPQGTVLLLLATGIVLIKLLHEAKNIQPVEAFFVLTLMLAQVAIHRVPYWRNMTTALIYASVVGGVVVLFTWFWWHGMDTLPRACHDDKAFFFAKVSIWHWFRTLNKVASVFVIVVGVAQVLFYVFSVTLFTFIPSANATRKYRDKDGGDSKGLGSLLGYGPLDLLIYIAAIVYVEMALKWNNISGVQSLASPGQFTPFIVALSQLLGLFYNIAKAIFQFGVDEGSSPDSESGEEEDQSCPHPKGWR